MHSGVLDLGSSWKARNFILDGVDFIWITHISREYEDVDVHARKSQGARAARPLFFPVLSII
jgi:hypothetical protein